MPPEGGETSLARVSTGWMNMEARPRRWCFLRIYVAHSQRMLHRIRSSGHPPSRGTHPLDVWFRCKRLSNSVSRELVLLYWSIGREILVRQQTLEAGVPGVLVPARFGTIQSTISLPTP